MFRLFIALAMSLLACGVAHADEVRGYGWRVMVVNRQNGEAHAFVTKESLKLPAMGGWHCRIVVNPATSELDEHTNEKVTKQGAAITCASGKSTVEAPSVANSHVSGAAQLILTDTDTQASYRINLVSTE